ncbi:hypothetical protein VNO78_28364 [Psophocarpus tetragonolobus]|uniref:Uncharacterized protein n=1 Tax=Psophocarpus tetragonolobus TaxID=3891 RepID=A0AAN9XBN6_PSOTE
MRDYLRVKDTPLVVELVLLRNKGVASTGSWVGSDVVMVVDKDATPILKMIVGTPGTGQAEIQRPVVEAKASYKWDTREVSTYSIVFTLVKEICELKREVKLCAINKFLPKGDGKQAAKGEQVLEEDKVTWDTKVGELKTTLRIRRALRQVKVWPPNLNLSTYGVGFEVKEVHIVTEFDESKIEAYKG